MKKIKMRLTVDVVYSLPVSEDTPKQRKFLRGLLENIPAQAYADGVVSGESLAIVSSVEFEVEEMKVEGQYLAFFT